MISTGDKDYRSETTYSLFRLMHPRVRESSELQTHRQYIYIYIYIIVQIQCVPEKRLPLMSSVSAAHLNLNVLNP